MSFRRILLKDKRGIPHGSLILHGCPPRVSLPQGVSPILCMTDKVFAPEGAVCLPFEDAPFSLLAKENGEILFASTLPKKDAAFIKWQLEEEVKRREERAHSPYKVPEESLESASEEQSEAPSECCEEGEENFSSEDASTGVIEGSEEREILKAEKLLAQGTPFPLFESMMPGSRWALIREDAAEYLVGILSSEEGAHVLLGIPGARNFPPDEDRLWSFFPTDEDGELGYFLTEAKELQR